MIEVSGLSKVFIDTKVVDDISFRVEKGETMVLLGTSGSGKTTTLKMLNRLVEPSAGAIKINGKDIFSENPQNLRKKIGYVIQDIGLFPHFTVEQNIAIVPNLLNWDNIRIEKRVGDLLQLMELEADLANRFPDELSGGQQQRVGIARALAADPPVVLLDEPFGALDPITRRQIQSEFKKIESFVSKTMVLVTHDVFEAIELGDKICLLDKGKIQQVGTPKELIYQPANSFVWDFFKTQRFQLEMKVFLLHDLLPGLKTSADEGAEKIIFNEQTSFLDTMERVEAVKSDTFQIAIFNEKEQKMLYTTKEQLWLAFNKVKENLLSKVI